MNDQPFRIESQDERPWNVLHVVFNHEKNIVRHLEAYGVEHYLPFFSRESRWRDRTVCINQPLFPGYVFAHINLQCRMNVLMIPGVLRILGNNQHTMVSAKEIARIREALEQGYILRPHDHIEVGTRVRVRDGVFKDTEGIVLRFSTNCSVIMMLSATQQRFSVEIQIANLEVLHSDNLQSICNKELLLKQ